MRSSCSSAPTVDAQVPPPVTSERLQGRWRTKATTMPPTEVSTIRRTPATPTGHERPHRQPHREQRGQGDDGGGDDGPGRDGEAHAEDAGQRAHRCDRGGRLGIVEVGAAEGRQPGGPGQAEHDPGHHRVGGEGGPRAVGQGVVGEGHRAVDDDGGGRGADGADGSGQPPEADRPGRQEAEDGDLAGQPHRAEGEPGRGARRTPRPWVRDRCRRPPWSATRTGGCGGGRGPSPGRR